MAKVYVEGDVLQIAQELQERYDGRVKLQYLNPQHPDAKHDDAPWRIVECRPDGREDVVFSVHVLDGRVLRKLEEIDAQKNEAYLDRVAKHELAAKKVKEQEKAALAAENREFIESMVTKDKTTTFKNSKGELMKHRPDQPTERVRDGYIT